MLLMCQPVASGSQPFFTCQVTSDGVPAVTPHASQLTTWAIRSSSYPRELASSTEFGAVSSLSSSISSCAVTWVSPQKPSWPSWVSPMSARLRKSRR